jgi:hypothetical protein
MIFILLMYRGRSHFLVKAHTYSLYLSDTNSAFSSLDSCLSTL